MGLPVPLLRLEPTHFISVAWGIRSYALHRKFVGLGASIVSQTNWGKDCDTVWLTDPFGPPHSKAISFTLPLLRRLCSVASIMALSVDLHTRLRTPDFNVHFLSKAPLLSVDLHTPSPTIADPRRSTHTPLLSRLQTPDFSDFGVLFWTKAPADSQ